MNKSEAGVTGGTLNPIHTKREVGEKKSKEGTG